MFFGEGDEKMFDGVLEDLRNFLKHRIPTDAKWLREARDTNGNYLGIDYGLDTRPPQEQSQFVDLWNDLHDYQKSGLRHRWHTACISGDGEEN